MVLLINYFDNLNLTKLINVSDLLFLITSIIILILSGSFLVIRNKINFAFAKMYTLISIYVLLNFIFLSTYLNNFRLNALDNSSFSDTFIYDFFSLKFKNLLYVFVIIFIIIFYYYLKNKQIITSFEYPIVFLLSILGMTFLLNSHDLFFWFLAIELQSFCFYALAAYRTNRSFLQTEAGLKYFLFGSIASSLYLFGISVIYVLFGTLNVDTLSILVSFPIYNQYIFNIALFTIFVGFSFKLGIAPFHVWVPLVYTYSSPIITYLFVLLPKIPLLYILYILAYFDIIKLIYLAIIFSLIIGGLFAIFEDTLVTFLAYSAIANNAFFLAPLINQSIYSFYTYIFYILVYNILLTIIFIPILFLKRCDQTLALTNLRDIIILKKSNSILALSFCFAIVSLAGIPPLLGFFSKFIVILNALSFSCYFLVLFLLTFALISAYYYLRLLKIMYFSSALKYAGLTYIPLGPSLIIAMFSLVNIFFIIYPAYLTILLNLL